jgi:hypothetical protein
VATVEANLPTLSLPIVITNVLPPATTIQSAQPLIAYIPFDTATAVTPTETVLLGPGTYTVSVNAFVLGEFGNSLEVSGEINVLAVRRSI